MIKTGKYIYLNDYINTESYNLNLKIIDKYSVIEITDINEENRKVSIIYNDDEKGFLYFNDIDIMEYNDDNIKLIDELKKDEIEIRKLTRELNMKKDSFHRKIIDKNIYHKETMDVYQFKVRIDGELTDVEEMTIYNHTQPYLYKKIKSDGVLVNTFENTYIMNLNHEFRDNFYRSKQEKIKKELRNYFIKNILNE